MDSEDRSTRKVHIICGMHRSGTSAFARLLHTHGIHMGTDMIPADPTNPAGHYEDLAFSELNRAILHHSNCPLYPQEKPDISFSQRHLEQGRELISQRNTTQPIWGWKDPRNSLTLPFWLHVLQDESFQCYVVLRDPESVCRSLVNREYYQNTPRGRWSILKRTFFRASYKARTAQRFDFFCKAYLQYMHSITDAYNQCGKDRFCVISSALLTTFERSQDLMKMLFDIEIHNYRPQATQTDIPSLSIDISQNNAILEEAKVLYESLLAKSIIPS